MSDISELVEKAVRQLITRNPATIRKALIKAGRKFTLKEVKEAIDEIAAVQQVKRVKKVSLGRFNSLGIDSNHFADLIDVQSIAKQNRGYRFILTVIDGFSRKAWAVPLKNKTQASILEAFRSIPEANILQTDQGKEFIGAKFYEFLKERGTHLKLAPLDDKKKQSLIERFNRTLTEKILLLQTMNENLNWVDHLQEVVKNYNEQKKKEELIKN